MSVAESCMKCNSCKTVHRHCKCIHFIFVCFAKSNCDSKWLLELHTSCTSPFSCVLLCQLLISL